MSYRLACELNEINSVGSVTVPCLDVINVIPQKTSTIHFHGTADGSSI